MPHERRRAPPPVCGGGGPPPASGLQAGKAGGPGAAAAGGGGGGGGALPGNGGRPPGVGPAPSRRVARLGCSRLARRAQPRVMAAAPVAGGARSEVGPGPAGLPGGGKPRWRISSSWARAAICCDISVAWIPWNSPSSQPTSCACAMRSSARSARRCRRAAPCARARPPGPATALGEVVDRLLVDLAQAHPALLVERGGRTSSSSVLTMEPMRSTLAGSFTDSSCAPPLLVPVPARQDLVGGDRLDPSLPAHRSVTGLSVTALSGHALSVTAPLVTALGHIVGRVTRRVSHGAFRHSPIFSSGSSRHGSLGHAEDPMLPPAGGSRGRQPSRGIIISAGVRDPCRAMSRSSPVSAGSRKRSVRTAPARRRPGAPTPPARARRPSQSSATICSFVRTQATSPCRAAAIRPRRPPPRGGRAASGSGLLR